jgi:flagellar motility protein MotE (MotC chaperone)
MAEEQQNGQEKRQSKGKGMKILMLAGGFLVSFAVICVGMYFVLEKVTPIPPPESIQEAADMSADTLSDTVAIPEVPDIDLTEYGLPADSLIAADEVKRAIAGLLEEQDQTRSELVQIQDNLNSRTITVDSLRRELAELMEQEGKIDARQINRLARIFESMKPAEVAPVMSQLTDDVNVMILMKMKERPAGKILSEMPVSRAAAISRMISEKILES